MSGSTEKAELLKGAHFMPLGGSQMQKLSREQLRKQKELAEARKSGKAPPEIDTNGNEVNPHIPQFISKAPWYLEDKANATTPLGHQRLGNDKHATQVPDLNSKSYSRGQRVGPAASKYRKGACTNCGAMSHSAKDCVERPRKMGARWTGKDIQADEVVQSLDLDWDTKRDRWNGYDASNHQRAFEKFEKLNEIRDRLKDGSNEEYPPDTEDAGPLHKFDVSTHSSTRNLRIREDKAKYLLDIKTAACDPYSPDTGKRPANDFTVASSQQDFTRPSEVSDFQKAQQFAWENERTGSKKLHLQANPTEGELEHRQFKKQKLQRGLQDREKLVAKYGEQAFSPSGDIQALTHDDSYNVYDQND